MSSSVVDGKAARACARLSRRRLVLTGSALKGATRGRLSLAEARTSLRRFCDSGALLRAGRDRYVSTVPTDSELKASTPTTVFPWWGSKKKALGLLVAIVRHEMARVHATTVVSPFVGSGVVEGALKNQGVRVRSSDKDPNVVNMHVTLGSRARRVKLCAHFRREAAALRRAPGPERKRRFQRLLRDEVLASRHSRGAPSQAARWLLGMKCAFFGMLRRSSALVEDRVDRLRVDSVCNAIMEHRGVGVECRKRDAFEVVRTCAKGRGTLLFLDPPYLVDGHEGQYQAGDFTLQQHQALAEALRGRSFVLCHRECERIRQLYPGCEFVRLPPIMNINAAGKRREEMVVIGRCH